MKLVVVDDHPLVADALRAMVASFLPSAEIIKLAALAELRSWLAADGTADLLVLDIQLSDGNSLDVLELKHQGLANCPIIIFTGADAQQLARAQAIEHSSSVTIVNKGENAQVLVRAIRKSLGFAEAEPELTLRQSELMELVSMGWSNLQIGEKLGITERTVKAHLGQVFDRLGVHNRAQAIRRFASMPRADAISAKALEAAA